MEQQAAAMLSSLTRVDRLSLDFSITETFQWSLNAAFAKDNHYTLFRYEDWPAWVLFSSVFAFLIIFDNVVLNRYPGAMTITGAVLYTLFWICCAVAFCGWVAWWKGEQSAYMWMSGYMLEWLLSFDNLFVFHLIFKTYQTPEHLKHRPLYLGICGAVFFRLVFIFIGEYLMHAMYFMHLVFGAFLIYTGVKTITADDEDDDPSQQPLVQWLTRRLPFVSTYDDKGAFFVRVPVDEHGEVICLEEPSGAAARPASGEPGAAAACEPGARAPDAKSSWTSCWPFARSRRTPQQASYGAVDLGAGAAKLRGAGARPRQWRATMLFLVVCCLEISDVLFAVDSVSAIVAQVNDLFLAYTSAVFAMLGLRATFFIIDLLAQLFSLLKFGVAGVLIFIGVKLMLSRVWHVPPGIVCLILLSCLGLSMVASIVHDRWNNTRSEEAKTSS